MRQGEHAVSGSWLLRELRSRSRRSQADFSIRTGVGQTVLSRIESGMQEPSLSALQRMIAAGTDYRLLIDAVPDPIGDVIGAADLTHLNEHRWAFDVRDVLLSRVIPETLQPRGGSFPHDEPTGPPASAAMYWSTQARRLAARAREPEARLQAAYGEYGDERDRDLIHQTLHCGTGAAQAAIALEASLAELPSSPKQHGRRARTEPQIGRLAWCHAVYAVAGEALICASAAAFCRLGARAAKTHSRALDDLAHAQQQLEFADRYAAEHEDGRTDSETNLIARANLATAEEGERQAAEERERMGHHGGTPLLLQIGAAGERILAEELEMLSKRAWALYEQMVDHTFRDWQLAAGETTPTEIPKSSRSSLANHKA